MTNQFVDANKMVPITPPPELLARWEEDWHHAKVKHVQLEDHIATQAARWGADQQLEQDAKWLDTNALYTRNLTVSPSGDALRQAMRPKPPSLKEQALAALQEAAFQADDCPPEGISDAQVDLIRRALEQLDD